MKNTFQFHRERRGALAGVDARSQRRRPRARADGARSAAQPRFAVSVPAGQLFLLPDRISRAGSGDRAGRRSRRRPADPVLPRKERGARDLGRLPLRPRCRARDLRLRRGLSDRASSTRSCPTSRRDRPALFTPLGLFEPWDRRVTQRAERRARSRAHRRVGARRSRRRARRARCDAPHEGRARGQTSCAVPARSPAARIAARWSARGPAGSNTRSRPSSCTSSCSTARRRSRIRRSSRRAPTRACSTTATTTAR